MAKRDFIPTIFFCQRVALTAAGASRGDINSYLLPIIPFYANVL